jgi:hypothetical protein
MALLALTVPAIISLQSISNPHSVGFSPVKN